MGALNILILIIFSFLLIKSSEWVIVALRRIAKKSKTAMFTISAVILAVGTSIPELFVSITSAIEGISNVALGVVLGSNIANTALIVGLISIFAGKIYVHGDYLKKDVVIAMIAGILPLGLLADGVLGRVDGLILIFVYAAYVASFFKDKFAEITNEHSKESFYYRFLREISNIDFDVTKEYGKLFASLAVLLFSANIIINQAQIIAVGVGISVFLVSLVVLAIGTSLPELVFSIKSIKAGEPKMFFGNLLGSTIANSTLIVGIASVIKPIQIQSFADYRNATMAFAIIYISLWLFVKSKHRLDRWEGAFLLLIYIVFIVIEFI